jgi:hypothetical protein
MPVSHAVPWGARYRLLRRKIVSFRIIPKDYSDGDLNRIRLRSDRLRLNSYEFVQLCRIPPSVGLSNRIRLRSSANRNERFKPSTTEPVLHSASKVYPRRHG